MKKTLLELYGLAVCFFAVACFVVVLGVVMWDAISLAAPDFALDSHAWGKHQSDEAFRLALIEKHRYGKEKDTYVAPEGAALSQERERSYKEAIRATVRDSLQGIVQNVIVLFLDAALFLIHWRLAAAARGSAS